MSKIMFAGIRHKMEFLVIPNKKKYNPPSLENILVNHQDFLEWSNLLQGASVLHWGGVIALSRSYSTSHIIEYNDMSSIEFSRREYLDLKGDHTLNGEFSYVWPHVSEALHMAVKSLNDNSRFPLSIKHIEEALNERPRTEDPKVLEYMDKGYFALESSPGVLESPFRTSEVVPHEIWETMLPFQSI